MADQWSGWNGVGRGVWGPGRANSVMRQKEGRGNIAIVAIGSGTRWESSEG